MNGLFVGSVSQVSKSEFAEAFRILDEIPGNKNVRPLILLHPDSEYHENLPNGKGVILFFPDDDLRQGLYQVSKYLSKKVHLLYSLTRIVVLTKIMCSNLNLIEIKKL